MKYCTAITCMDGRIQIPVINYLKERFDVEYVDIISEPGPNAILAKQDNPVLIDSILSRLKLSVELHKSIGFAIVGHFDCAGNPTSQEEQENHTRFAIEFIKKYYYHGNIVGLWVDKQSKVIELI
ncbi:carbonic anhydrase [Acidobacteriota bacterium]